MWTEGAYHVPGTVLRKLSVLNIHLTLIRTLWGKEYSFLYYIVNETEAQWG